MKRLFATGVLALMPSFAFAQTPDPVSSVTQPTYAGDTSLANPAGHQVSAGISSYTYREPGDLAISIHGAKFKGDYAGTFLLDKQRHWFARAEFNGTIGNVAYNGWCYPFIISPNSSSPNGYELDVGDSSPCDESGDKDWYVEGRGLAGKDFIGERWGWSPYSGLGLRHLSNGTSGVPGYRTDDYLYVPLGMTARTRVGSRRPMSVNVEYDVLLHGWQRTRDSQLGGGDVPATLTAPAFTLDGFTDISFSQSRGWALRVNGEYPLTSRLSLQPYYVRWSVTSSPVNYETATFTVNNITAQEQLGAYEPYNTTNEFGIKLGFHF